MTFQNFSTVCDHTQYGPFAQSPNPINPFLLFSFPFNRIDHVKTEGYERKRD